MLLLRLRETLLLPLRPIIREYELTDAQSRVLIILSGLGAMDMSTLAETCCIHPPSLSRIVPRLEARKLVQRERLGTDKRQQRVELTSEGERLTTHLRTALRSAYGEFKSQISEGALQRLTVELQNAIVMLGSPSVADE